MKKYLKILCSYIIVVSISYSGTIWKFSSGVNGSGGLMIVYKTYPPLVVNVEKSKIMRVKKGNEKFTYSKVIEGGKPLNVDISINFNQGIIDENGVNKEIIRSIYNNVTLSLKNNGKFYLETLVNDESYTIDAQAYFTDKNGTRINDKSHPIINKELLDSIQNGALRQSDIYIDAEFNSERKELKIGKYSGSVILEVEFNGKNI